MKNANTAKIDGFEVIVGVVDAIIDPAASTAEATAYFEPSRGQIRITDETEVLLLSLFKEGSFVLMDFTTIEDHRGRSYFEQASPRAPWVRKTIKSLGFFVPEGVPLEMSKAMEDHNELCAYRALDVKDQKEFISSYLKTAKSQVLNEAYLLAIDDENIDVLAWSRIEFARRKAEILQKYGA